MSVGAKAGIQTSNQSGRTALHSACRTDDLGHVVSLLLLNVWILCLSLSVYIIYVYMDICVSLCVYNYLCIYGYMCVSALTQRMESVSLSLLYNYLCICMDICVSLLLLNVWIGSLSLSLYCVCVCVYNYIHMYVYI